MENIGEQKEKVEENQNQELNLNHSGIDRNWLLTCIKEDYLATVEKPKVSKERKKFRTAKTQIEVALYNMYEGLRDGESADALDTFKPYLSKSNQKRFDEIISKIAKALNTSPTFFAIAECVCEEEKDGLEAVRKIINAETKRRDSPMELVDELDFYSTEEEAQEGLTHFVDKSIQEIEEVLEKNKEHYAEYFKRLEEVRKTPIGEIASQLNEIVFLGTDIWEMIVYALLSPHSPKILIDSLPTRNAIHLMMAGDISTAKSKTLKLCELVSPKATRRNKFTEASLEGVANKEKIEEGLIDKANNGVLIVPEFDKIIKEFGLLRDVLDNDRITIEKGGHEKECDINIPFLTGINPKTDFFVTEVVLREQIGFSEGLLSRFDLLIPIISTRDRNEYIIKKQNIFGDTPSKVNLSKVRQVLVDLSRGMVNIEKVFLNDEQKSMLKNAWIRHNKELDYRPLILPRDMETLCRLVNVIVMSNFHKRKVENKICFADNEDVEKATDLWETLIDLKSQLYTSMRRTILTVKDKILMEILSQSRETGFATIEGLIQGVVENPTAKKCLCSRATLYRKLDDLVLDRKIVKEGLRDVKIIPIL